MNFVHDLLNILVRAKLCWTSTEYDQKLLSLLFCAEMAKETNKRLPNLTFNFT